MRGFANKKPPAYHCLVKIPPSILNSIHSVNHWKWILHSDFFFLIKPSKKIESLLMIVRIILWVITNIFDKDWWWWVSISEIPSMPSCGDGMFYLSEVILKPLQKFQYLGQIEPHFINRTSVKILYFKHLYRFPYFQWSCKIVMILRKGPISVFCCYLGLAHWTSPDFIIRKY